MKKALLAILLLTPGFAFAANFASQSIFLSNPMPIAGESVVIHTIVSNDAAASFTGKIEISDGQTLLSTQPVSIGASQAQVISVAWRPAAGSHTLTADLYNSAGIVTQEEQATFNIPAQRTVANTPAVQSSEIVTQHIADISNPTANKLAPLFSTIDMWRTLAAQSLTQGIAWATNEVAQAQAKKAATGTQGLTSSTSLQTVLTTLWLIVSLGLQYLLIALRYAVVTVLLFYAIVVVLILYIVWRLLQTLGGRR